MAVSHMDLQAPQLPAISNLRKQVEVANILRNTEVALASQLPTPAMDGCPHNRQQKLKADQHGINMVCHVRAIRVAEPRPTINTNCFSRDEEWILSTKLGFFIQMIMSPEICKQ